MMANAWVSVAPSTILRWVQHDDVYGTFRMLGSTSEATMKRLSSY
jgi:hypothetical protein